MLALHPSFFFSGSGSPARRWTSASCSLRTAPIVCGVALNEGLRAGVGRGREHAHAREPRELQRGHASTCSGAKGAGVLVFRSQEVVGAEFFFVPNALDSLKHNSERKLTPDYSTKTLKAAGYHLSRSDISASMIL